MFKESFFFFPWQGCLPWKKKKHKLLSYLFNLLSCPGPIILHMGRLLCDPFLLAAYSYRPFGGNQMKGTLWKTNVSGSDTSSVSNLVRSRPARVQVRHLTLIFLYVNSLLFSTVVITMLSWHTHRVVDAPCAFDSCYHPHSLFPDSIQVFERVNDRLPSPSITQFEHTWYLPVRPRSIVISTCTQIYICLPEETRGDHLV